MMTFNFQPIEPISKGGEGEGRNPFRVLELRRFEPRVGRRSAPTLGYQTQSLRDWGLLKSALQPSTFTFHRSTFNFQPLVSHPVHSLRPGEGRIPSIAKSRLQRLGFQGQRDDGSAHAGSGKAGAPGGGPLSLP